MANAQFEVWIARRFKVRFESDADPGDAVACVALLKSEAKRYGVKPSTVELKVRHKGRTKVYRGS